MATKHIYLVRHGETEANSLNVVPGKDEQLNEVGQQQAVMLAERTQNLDFEKLLVSDFIRTSQTAQPIIEAKKILPEVVSDLGEMWEPSSFIGVSETDENVLEFRKKRFNNLTDPHWQFEDAENIYNLVKRTERVRKKFETSQCTNMLVVSHAMFLRYFLATILLESANPSPEVVSIARNLKITNTGISLITYDGGKWKVVMINDHAHFAE